MQINHLIKLSLTVDLGYKDKHKIMPNNLHIYVLHLCVHVPVTTMAIIANKLINSSLVLYVTLAPNILISGSTFTFVRVYVHNTEL